jgi:CheY-like chemotaxis protein
MEKNQIRVLVLDDDLQEAGILLDYLRGGNESLFEIVLVETLAEGCEKLQAEQAFDVILLDPELPDCGIDEAFQAVQDLARDAPVLLMTAGNPPGRSAVVPIPGSLEDEGLDQYRWLSWAIQYALARKRLVETFPGDSEK